MCDHYNSGSCKLFDVSSVNCVQNNNEADVIEHCAEFLLEYNNPFAQ